VVVLEVVVVEVVVAVVLFEGGTRGGSDGREIASVMILSGGAPKCKFTSDPRW